MTKKDRKVTIATKKAMAQAELVKAQYNYDKLSGKLKSYARYSEMLSTHYNKEDLMPFLNGEITAQQLLDRMDASRRDSETRKEAEKAYIKICEHADAIFKIAKENAEYIKASIDADNTLIPIPGDEYPIMDIVRKAFTMKVELTK